MQGRWAIPILSRAPANKPNHRAVSYTHLDVYKRQVAALADAAERLLADGVLADQMGERGRAKVAGQYSWNSVAERVHAHYRCV